jgi:hypothetical protein
MVVEHLIQTRVPMAMHDSVKVDKYLKAQVSHGEKNGIESGPTNHQH